MEDRVVRPSTRCLRRTGQRVDDDSPDAANVDLCGDHHGCLTRRGLRGGVVRGSPGGDLRSVWRTILVAAAHRARAWIDEAGRHTDWAFRPGDRRVLLLSRR